jgi:starch-binding outer membrane protein, SusD/RagB family
MKSIKFSLSVLSLIAAILLFYGCDGFLNVPAKGSLSEDVLADQQGVETLLIGAYGALDAGSLSGLPWATSPHNWIYGSVVGGDAHKGSEPGDQSAINPMMGGVFSPTEGFFNNKWLALYEGISRANAVLRVLERVEGMTDAQIAAKAGEARFLRGHYYFELRKMFHRVPWIDENTEELNQPNDREIWPDIEADFQFAYDNLPATQSERARVNRWAAASYLARAYVYQEKWPEAKALYDVIIPNGVTSQGVPYGLTVGYFDNWNPALEDGNPEAVFSIQQVANDGSGTINNANQGMMLNFPNSAEHRCCGFYSPTQDLVNSYRTEDGLPIIDGFGYNAVTVDNDMGVSSSNQFEPYGGELDPRLDWNVGRRGVPYHDWGPFPGQRWIRDQSFGGPYYAKKNVYWRSQEGQFADNSSWAPGTAINIPIIRFADVLLMAAEAEIEAGTLEQARTYVNLVRERAANSDHWVSNDLNREYAAAIVNSEAEMLSASVTSGQWVVRDDTGTTFTYLGGGTGDINNWNEYPEPNYNIEQYLLPWADPTAAREAVHFERKLELAMEGHRFFDLVRWGTAANQLDEVYTYEPTVVPNGGFTGGQFRADYFPIPQNQIDLSNGVLVQNDWH